MDIVDRAEALEERQRNLALKHHKSAQKELPQDIVDGVVYCIDCGVKVQEERLKAKPDAARCIGCQGIYEQRSRYRA